MPQAEAVVLLTLQVLCEDRGQYYCDEGIMVEDEAFRLWCTFVMLLKEGM